MAASDADSRYLTIPIRSDKLTVSVQVRSHLANRTTDFQTIDVYDTEAFGRILTLDGHIQLTELDEGVYHEFLVHPALMSINQPKAALVVGGGDGGVLRELCRHDELKHIDMAEIDEGVIHESKEWLPFVSDGAFDDPRVNLHITDAFAFVKEAPRKYDLIVVDSTDVYEEESGGLSEALFTAEFYQDCLNALSPQGIVVTQADNIVFCPYSLEHIEKMFRSVFPQVGSYFAVVPSFGGYSGYCWGSPSAGIQKKVNPDRFNLSGLRFLNPISYTYAFSTLELRRR